MSGSGKELNILWLWPDILNMHGDRGNAMALARICGLYGIEAKVTRATRLSDDFSFEGADIALLGAGELIVLPSIVGALSKRFAELKEWLDRGGVLFATGTTGAALGTHTVRIDGSHIYGLGLLDMECREREAVLGDDLIFRTTGNTAMPGRKASAGDGTIPGVDAIPDIDMAPGSDMVSGVDATLDGDMFPVVDATSDVAAIYGIQIQMMDVFLAEGQPPFGETIYGYGNNGKGAEGAVKGGVIFTNALGPVLVKNPWLTLGLINKALARKGRGATEAVAADADAGAGVAAQAVDADAVDANAIAGLRFDPKLFGAELASAAAIKAFNETKERPK